MPNAEALALTHDESAIGGCDQAVAWTEIHHLHPWSLGGRTNLADALPLCGIIAAEHTTPATTSAATATATKHYHDADSQQAVKWIPGRARVEGLAARATSYPPP